MSTEHTVMTVSDDGRTLTAFMSLELISQVKRDFTDLSADYPKPGDVMAITLEAGTADYTVVAVQPVKGGVDITATHLADWPDDPRPVSWRKSKLMRLRQSAEKRL